MCLGGALPAFPCYVFSNPRCVLHLGKYHMNSILHTRNFPSDKEGLGVGGIFNL